MRKPVALRMNSSGSSQRRPWGGLGVVVMPIQNTPVSQVGQKTQKKVLTTTGCGA